MPPRRRTAAKSKAQSSNNAEIPEDEQWRLIRESGLLQQIPQETQQETPVETDDDDEENSIFDEIFSAILLIIPFSFLLIMMEILVHQQYGQPTSLKNMFDRLLSGVPLLSLFIFYSNRYKSHRRMKFMLFLLSLAAGPRLIYVVNKASWITNMKQSPPLATLWVYTIVQLDLGPAVLSLCLIGVWYWWSGFKFAFKLYI